MGEGISSLYLPTEITSHFPWVNIYLKSIYPRKVDFRLVISAKKTREMAMRQIKNQNKAKKLGKQQWFFMTLVNSRVFLLKVQV